MKDKSLFTIEEFTSPDPVTVSPAASGEEVVTLLHKHHFRHLPVVEHGKVIGIISDRDVLIARPLGVSAQLTAREIMTRDPYSVNLDAPLEEVALALSAKKIGSAVVLDRAGKFYGIFTSTDALNALVELLRNKD